MMAIGSVMTFAMNQVFLSFPEWGETPAAVFGVYFKLQSFVIMPVLGLNNACISIVAYNYGAQEPGRITKLLKYAIAIAMGNMLLGVALFQLAPNVLLKLFDPSPEFRTMGVRALQIVSLHFPMAAIGIVLGACFQALGNGIYSTITSLCRQLVVLVPAAYLLSLSGQVDLVWWSFPIAEVVSMLLSIFFYLRIYRKQIKPLF